MGWFTKSKKTVNPNEQEKLLRQANKLADELVSASQDLRAVVRLMHKENVQNQPRITREARS